MVRSTAETSVPKKLVRQSFSVTARHLDSSSIMSARMSFSALQPYSRVLHSKCRYRLR